MTRESAKNISEAMATTSVEGATELALDFEGIEAVTPSFVDELLALADGILRRRGAQPVRLFFLNTPTRLSAKFAAIARARDVSISESQDGVWSITSSAA